jgi:hypothetical protein
MRAIEQSIIQQERGVSRLLRLPANSPLPQSSTRKESERLVKRLASLAWLQLKVSILRRTPTPVAGIVEVRVWDSGSRAPSICERSASAWMKGSSRVLLCVHGAVDPAQSVR